MVESGQVIKLNKNGYCVVSFDRKSACDQCHMCVASKNGKKVELTVENTVQAQVGDYVEVTMGDSAVLASSAIVYLIPLFTVALGAVAGYFINEIAQLILAAVGLAAGLAVAVLMGRVFKKKKGYSPVITKLARAEDVHSSKCRDCLRIATCSAKFSGECEKKPDLLKNNRESDENGNGQTNSGL